MKKLKRCELLFINKILSEEHERLSAEYCRVSTEAEEDRVIFELELLLDIQKKISGYRKADIL